MAVALIGRICDLLPKFGADALVLRGALQPAGTITARTFKTLADHFYNFLITIQFDSHLVTSFPLHYKNFFQIVKKTPDVIRQGFHHY